MLEMKSACERCHAVLRLDSEVFICSHECTFCGPCTFGDLAQTCPNCGGELSRRPKRIEKPDQPDEAKVKAKPKKKAQEKLL